MIVRFPNKDGEKLIPLFNNYKYLKILIIAILKGKKADIFVDNILKPTVCLICYKVFNILGGEYNKELVAELFKYIFENRFLLMPNKEWEKDALTTLKLSPYIRVKLSAEKLSIESMDKFLKAKLPENFFLSKLDIATIKNLNSRLLPAFLPFFNSPNEVIEKGLAYCVKEGDKVVSIAGASMPIYDNEFVIQVITDSDKNYRRKGYATIACAALIKDCLEKGIKPQWDADNEISTRFALKLGFTKPEHYTGYITAKNPLIENEKNKYPNDKKSNLLLKRVPQQV